MCSSGDSSSTSWMGSDIVFMSRVTSVADCRMRKFYSRGSGTLEPFIIIRKGSTQL